jgi:hypothetical protein
LKLLFQGTRIADNTTLSMFFRYAMTDNLNQDFHEASSDSMFKRSNHRFVFVLHVGNVVEYSSGNLTTVVSAVAAQKTKKAMSTLSTIQSLLLLKTQ